MRELGGGQRIYFMAPVRYWHWQGGNARPGEGGEPATYDIPLAVSRDGFNFSCLLLITLLMRPALIFQPLYKETYSEPSHFT